MNDAQFDALLAALHGIEEELMLLRDEVSEFRDIFGQANGFESDIELHDRIEKALRDGTIFDDPDATRHGKSA